MGKNKAAKGGPDAERRASLEQTLEARFAAHPERHKGIEWTAVRARLESRPEKWRVLLAMEESGGEPDVLGVDPETGEFLFVDCSRESPAGRRSVCYDRAGLESRKAHKPKNTAVDMANAMGVELLDEARYLWLQRFGEFDTKTSSWLATPPEFRKCGSALFGDSHHGRTFIYQNGAQSYYAVRGFRGMLRV